MCQVAKQVPARSGSKRHQDGRRHSHPRRAREIGQLWRALLVCGAAATSLPNTVRSGVEAARGRGAGQRDSGPASAETCPVRSSLRWHRVLTERLAGSLRPDGRRELQQRSRRSGPWQQCLNFQRFVSGATVTPIAWPPTDRLDTQERGVVAPPPLVARKMQMQTWQQLVP